MRDLIWIQKILKGERWNSKIREEAKEVGKKEGNGNYSMREGE